MQFVDQETLEIFRQFFRHFSTFFPQRRRYTVGSLKETDIDCSKKNSPAGQTISFSSAHPTLDFKSEVMDDGLLPPSEEILTKPRPHAPHLSKLLGKSPAPQDAEGTLAEL